MASGMAVRRRLTNWLLATQMRNDSFALQSVRFTKSETNLNCLIGGISRLQVHPRANLHSAVKTLQLQELNLKHRHCQLCQKQYWSSTAARVPQLDLEANTDSESDASHPEPKVVATEVLQNLSPDDARKLKIIKLEFDVVEQMYGMVPEIMTDENWLIALNLESKSQRMRYYAFLRKNQLRDKSRRQKQEIKQQQRAEKLAEDPEEVKEVAKNTIFLRFYDSTIKKVGNYRLAHAMQFGQPLIFDLDYEPFMRHQDCQNLVDQLLMTYGKNRDAPTPFNFIFSSLNPTGKVFSMLQRSRLYGQNFMGTMTDRSYLDLFPKERLVYLSPHSSQVLEEVSEDDVYIVGGFIDKSCHKPISMARAKEQGIRTAKFPLDKYLIWGMGSKSLTLDQVMGILLEQRRTKDWEQAFKVIPQRKLHREDA